MQVPPFSAIQTALQESKRVLIATHINPDGDALGSACALAHLALHCGSEPRMFASVDALPVFLSWLPLPAPLVNTLDSLGDWTPDLLMFIDCGDSKRAGPELQALLVRGELPSPSWHGVLTVNMDHHASNTGYAAINWVEPDRSASGELVGMLAEYMGLPLTGDLGQALYLALCSDTGNFTFANTTAESLAMAARIVAGGLNVGSFIERYENNWTMGRMHLWGRLMGEVSPHGNGAVVCSVVYRRYLDELGLKTADLEGFASWLRRLHGVRVVLFVREDGSGLSKISMRSMGDVDVGAIAALFHGGGHIAAAGAELALPPDAAAQAVLKEILSRLS